MADTCPVLGLLVPPYFLLMSSLGFTARVGSALFALQSNVVVRNVEPLRCTSGATPADLLMASITASHFLTCISRDGTWLGFEWAITQTEDERATIEPATRL